MTDPVLLNKQLKKYSDRLEECIVKLKHYKNESEIPNPVYVQLKKDVNHCYDELYRWRVQETYLSYVKEREDPSYNKDVDIDWQNVYYLSSGLRSVMTLGKELNKLKAKWEKHEIYKIAHAFYMKFLPIAADMESLKPKVVKAGEKREQVKAAKEVVLKKQYSDASTLLKALEPVHKEFLERTRDITGKRYDTLKKQLKEHGMEKLAPKWDYNKHGYNVRTEMKNKEAFWTRIEKTPKKQFVEEQIKASDEEFRAYVAKLIGKIGTAVKTAKITGDPWTGSVITVKTVDGEVQTWNTKIIINQSKYARAFNQFPTRKVK